MSRLVAAALVLLMTIAALFGAAAWNRSGPVQSIVLTERELALPWNWPSDDVHQRLRLEWQGRDEPQDARLWLTDAKLRELGFTTGVPPGAPEAEYVYGRSLPRLAWVAFELNGPAWRLLEQRRSLIEPGESMRHGVRPADWSRLVPIDAAPVPETLRRRYADAPVVVLQAVIRMRYRTTAEEGPSVWARVDALVSPDLSIPLRFRGRLPRTAKQLTASPRYEVDFRVGRLGVVWVEEVRPLSIE